MKKNLLFTLLLTSLFLSTTAQKTLTCDKSVYAPGVQIVFTYTNAVSTTDWIGIYKQGVIPSGANYETWNYVPNSGNGTKTFSNSLAIGTYDSYFMCCDKYDSIFVKGPTFQVSNSTGINDHFNNDLFSIYPNPANGSFTMEFSKETSGILELYDLAGHLVYNNSVKKMSTLPVQATGLSKGIYLIKFCSAEQIYNQKLIIE